MSNTDNLHTRALELVSRYKRMESELLDLLLEIENEKVFLRLGYGSMFDYAVRALGLSEGTAYSFVNVARKSREVPELKAAIAAGDITVSKARKITSVLTRENAAHWLQLAKEASQSRLEREVAKVHPEEVPEERARYVQENLVSLQVALPEEVYEQIRHLQDLESKRQRKAVSIAETLAAMAAVCLKKPTPRAAKKEQQFSRTVRIPVAMKRKVEARDRGRCQYKGCGHTRFTEIHHIKPRSEGGGHDLANLITLCSAHHRFVHEENSS